MEFLSQNLRHSRVDLIWGFSASLQISWTAFLDDGSNGNTGRFVDGCEGVSSLILFPHNRDNDGNETHSKVSFSHVQTIQNVESLGDSKIFGDIKIILAS